VKHVIIGSFLLGKHTLYSLATAQTRHAEKDQAGETWLISSIQGAESLQGFIALSCHGMDAKALARWRDHSGSLRRT